MKVVIAFLINTLFNFAIGLLVARFLGPSQFGRFALTVSIGMVLQVLLFDWIRLSTTRFYSEKARSARPELRATLDVTYAIIALIVASAAMAVMLSGVRLPLSNGLIGLAVAASITNGLFDYSTALVRARFHDALYTRLIITKNILAITLTAGGAYVFGSANMALLGVCVSMGGSVLIARKALSDEHASPQLAHRNLAADCLRYSAPIVAANFLYILIPLINRSLVASRFGFAESGQYSLAFDIGTRIVAAIGSALDVLLFQIAVRADELHGREQARDQVARNMTIVLLVLLPSCLGVWLVLPSLQDILVPSQYRGPFAHYLTLLMPGLFCYGLMSFAVNPIFQIRKSTLPMIVGALVACLTDASLSLLLPGGKDASVIAVTQAASFVAALAALILISLRAQPKWPKPRDLAAILGAAAAMTALVFPLREMRPSLLILAAQALLGGSVYAAVIWTFNVADLREVVRSHAGALLKYRRGSHLGAARRPEDQSAS